jgi:hypothetical protein
VALSTYHTVAVQFADRTPGVGSSGVNDWEIYINGALAVFGELSTLSPSSADPQGQLEIGRRSESASEFYEGALFYSYASKGLYAKQLAGYLERQRA